MNVLLFPILTFATVNIFAQRLSHQCLLSALC